MLELCSIMLHLLKCWNMSFWSSHTKATSFGIHLLCQNVCLISSISSLIMISCKFLKITVILLISSKSAFPKLCAAEECRESFMFWQNLLYVISLPLQSLWRVRFYKVGVPRPNPVFIIVCRNEKKFEKRCSKYSLSGICSGWPSGIGWVFRNKATRLFKPREVLTFRQAIPLLDIISRTELLEGETVVNTPKQ